MTMTAGSRDPSLAIGDPDLRGPRTMRHTVVFVTSSYPRFRGDTVGTFMEPIARGIAARGHAVHVVAPWHPTIDRPASDGGVQLHYFRYAPVAGLNVFGYASSLRADVTLRGSALLAAPFAVAAGWYAARRVARRYSATIMHGHWVVPGGVIAAAAAAARPLVISLHGSDVYIAERYRVVGWTAEAALRRARWVTACSDDLARRAVMLGAAAERVDVVPYGVDVERFSANIQAREDMRRALGLDADAPLLFSAGRLVRKKGFEYLIDAVSRLVSAWPTLRTIVAGGGDLERELRERAERSGAAARVDFLGPVSQDDIPRYLAAADLVAVPSVRDVAGNVDGLPNFLLEALASGRPVVTTDVGGIASVARHGETAELVPPGDAAALAAAIDGLLRDPERGHALGAASRNAMRRSHGWEDTAERFERVYDRVATAAPP